MENFYERLGVSKNASLDEIKRAYRKLALKYHPDTSVDPDAESKFRLINEAYEVLSVDEKRAEYDKNLDKENEKLVEFRIFPTEIDFGEVKIGSIETRSFIIELISGDPQKPECKFTAPTWADVIPKEDKENIFPIVVDIIVDAEELTEGELESEIHLIAGPKDYKVSIKLVVVKAKQETVSASAAPTAPVPVTVIPTYWWQKDNTRGALIASLLIGVAFFALVSILEATGATQNFQTGMIGSLINNSINTVFKAGLSFLCAGPVLAAILAKVLRVIHSMSPATAYAASSVVPSIPKLPRIVWALIIVSVIGAISFATNKVAVNAISQQTAAIGAMNLCETAKSALTRPEGKKFYVNPKIAWPDRTNIWVFFTISGEEYSLGPGQGRKFSQPIVNVVITKVTVLSLSTGISQDIPCNIQIVP